MLTIKQIEPDRLTDYAKIPIAFEVKSIFEVDLIDDGLGGITLREVDVPTPYIKDYDSYEEGGPTHWPKHFDIKNFTIFMVHDGDHPVGGATVVSDAPDIYMLRGRKDLAILWDIRVLPQDRRAGIGSHLFGHVVDWARQTGNKQLKIETQNVNVPACRFYAKQGCHLGEIDRYAYARHPHVAHETMLIWYLNL
jgi:GNAT superfamily N-acetyltransferase